MAYLSIRNPNGPVTGIASSIFFLDLISISTGTETRFEILETYADGLKELVGEYRCFYVDPPSVTFWAQLKSLEPSVSTHHGLAGLRSEPAMIGVFSVIKEPSTKQ
jgi:hypothetical protein